MIRFTKQELNRHEEADFSNFWNSRINSELGDVVSIYNVHNTGGNVLLHINDGLNNQARAEIKNKKLKCSEIYDRLDIASDGSLNFCCGDQFGRIPTGNVLNCDPIELYNSSEFIRYRAAMERGDLLECGICKDCSVAWSIVTREIGVVAA